MGGANGLERKLIPNHLADQADAASAETRELYRAASAGRELPISAPTGRARQVFDRLLSARSTRCPHITAVPIQPAFVDGRERHIRCRACLAEHVAAREQACRAGISVGLNPLREASCDSCGRYVGHQPLTAAFVRLKFWVLDLKVCEACEVIFTNEGQLLERRAI